MRDPEKDSRYDHGGDSAEDREPSKDYLSEEEFLHDRGEEKKEHEIIDRMRQDFFGLHSGHLPAHELICDIYGYHDGERQPRLDKECRGDRSRGGLHLRACAVLYLHALNDEIHDGQSDTVRDDRCFDDHPYDKGNLILKIRIKCIIEQLIDQEPDDQSGCYP